jgi:hypothetical protein
VLGQYKDRDNVWLILLAERDAYNHEVFYVIEILLLKSKAKLIWILISQEIAPKICLYESKCIKRTHVDKLGSMFALTHI